MESSNIDGSNRQTLGLIYSSSINFYHGSIYYLYDSNRIGSLSTVGGNVTQLDLWNCWRIRDFKIVSIEQQLPGTIFVHRVIIIASCCIASVLPRCSDAWIVPRLHVALYYLYIQLWIPVVAIMADAVIFVFSVQLIQEVTLVLVQMALSYTRTDCNALVNMQ